MGDDEEGPRGDRSLASSAEGKVQETWKKLLDRRESSLSSISDDRLQQPWPTYNEILADVRKTDYNFVLSCPLDIHPGNIQTSNDKIRQKKICSRGVVCQATLELFPFPSECDAKPYTGLLTPGTNINHCIVRLSSALPPSEVSSRVGRMILGTKLSGAKVFPAVAFKVFRGNDVPSGNLLFLGCKVGQVEDNFFAHCLCTQLTKRMPPTLRPVLGLFAKYSDHPLALGISDFCTFDQLGNACKDINFPFAVTLSPPLWEIKDKRHERQNEKKGLESNDKEMKQPKIFDRLDSSMDDLSSIPIGTVIYDIFASPDPLSVGDGTKLQRIGQIRTSSEMMESLSDDGLFFRHQKKDDDYELRPDWRQNLGAKIVLNDGTEGTVATLAGWELFEGLIQEGEYVDFQRI